jgi:hypothetical protein
MFDHVRLEGVRINIVGEGRLAHRTELSGLAFGGGRGGGSGREEVSFCLGGGDVETRG